MANRKSQKSEKYPDLTSRQEMIYDFICKYLKQHPYPPTVRDIQRSLKIKSTSTVQYALDALQLAGYIQKSDGKMRSIEIKTMDQFDISKNIMLTPILGSIAAGEPILADQNISEYYPLPSGIYNTPNDLFILEVKGNSMIDVGIFNGDYVVIEQCSNANNGEIVAALVGDSATIKRFYQEDDYIRLQPENKEMSPIIVKEGILILGRVVGLFRNHIH